MRISYISSLRAFVFLVLVLVSFPGIIYAKKDVKQSLVKIFTVQTKPNYYNPWDMRNPVSISGSGCVIKGNRILTNAHVVSDHTIIRVSLHGHAKKYKAHIVAISHETDLAILSVDDSDFFRGVKPIVLGDLPAIQREVTVYGFPKGGDTLSITKGIVSRIEHQVYVHSSESFLAIQIDAAINAGNSGGPAMVNNKLIGIVMQSIPRADNIGYIVPVTIVKHFLEDLKDGNYDGFPEEGTMIQPMENEGLKKMYGLDGDLTGILVVDIVPGLPVDGILKPEDVILSIDGNVIADNCTVEFRPNERTSANYYIQQHQYGDELSLAILRNKKKMILNISLIKPDSDIWLVPKRTYDTLPEYFIYGGLVFCPLTTNYLYSWGKNWRGNAPHHMVSYVDKYSESEDEEVVILMKVMPYSVNNGYHNERDRVIEEINGQKILNLKSMIKIIEASEDAFIKFKTHKNNYIVMDRKQVEAENNEILTTYRVPGDRSDNYR